MMDATPYRPHQAPRLVRWWWRMVRALRRTRAYQIPGTYRLHHRKRRD